MNKKLIKNGLLTTLGVVSATIPLATAVSCGKAEQQDNRVGSEYDKEYGVDEAVYEKLKSSFVSQATAGLTESEATKVKKSLNKTFNICDSQMDEMNLSYTAISNGLIEYAARVYPNVKLVRETTKKTVKWDDLTVEFEGMKNSMKAYMDNLGIHGDDQKPFLEEANRVFNGTADTTRYPGIVKTVKTKYHDPLMGLMQAKAQMLQCFESVDEKIGLVGASIRLSQFMENHEIFYDNTTDDNAPNKFDNMKKTWLNDAAKGKSIEDHITKIFKITDKTTGKILEKFDPESVCPGYIVKPILKGWTEDPIKNEYKLNIDWTCICSAHKDSKNAGIATAHFYNSRPTDFSDSNSVFDFDAFMKKMSEESGRQYDVILSRQGEIDALKNTYFNDADEHIVFDWMQNQVADNALDAFFFGDRTDDRMDPNSRKYIIDTRTLAMTGLNVGTKVADQNADNFVRLDSLMQTSAVDEEEKQNCGNDLINDFLRNCKIWSDVDVNVDKDTNDIGSTIKTSIHAQYSNSSYDDESSKCFDVTSDKKVNTSWFTVSEKSYMYLTEQYNRYAQYTEPYANNTFASDDEECDSEITLNSILLGLSGIFALTCTAFCFVPVFAGKIPIYIALLVLTWFSMGLQSASLGLLVKYKHKPLEKFKEEDDKLIKKASVKNFVDYVKETSDKYYLCRANDSDVVKKGSEQEQDTYLYNLKKFREDFGTAGEFVTRVLPAIDQFQTMSSSEAWEAFTSDVNNSECSPSKFEEAMKGWAAKGVFTITNWVCMGVQMAVDIVCVVLMARCPEMMDWQLMKEARLAALESGETTSTIIKNYKTLSEIKSFRKAIEQATKDAQASESLYKELISRFVKSIDGEKLRVAKFADYSGQLREAMPEATKFIRGFQSVLLNEDKEGCKLIANEFNELLKSKKGGFEFSFLKAFNIRRTEFPTCKIVDSFDGLGTLLARNFVRDMKSITSPIAEAAYDATNPLIGFQRWFISLDESAQKTISTVITNAEKYLKNGALVEAVDEFAKIDEVMNNFIKSGGVGEDQVAWIEKVGDGVIEALNAPIKWSANMMNYLRTLMHENQPIVFLVI